MVKALFWTDLGLYLLFMVAPTSKKKKTGLKTVVLEAFFVTPLFRIYAWKYLVFRLTCMLLFLHLWICLNNSILSLYQYVKDVKLLTNCIHPFHTC